jgi:ribosomal protein S18 acetylase RimI-like enzyme
MVAQSLGSAGEIALPQKGYRLRQGSTLDRALLLQTMRRTYQELYPHQTFDHLGQTLDAYFSNQTPLLWVEPEPDTIPAAIPATSQTAPSQGLVRRDRPVSVGCLWMGTATDQVSGLRHAHIFLLYIHPDHRRQGLGRALMLRAEAWASERGDRQISLQVFEHNGAALHLYQGLGYLPQSIALVKRLGPGS